VKYHMLYFVCNLYNVEWSCDLVFIYVLFYIQIIYLVEFYLWLGDSVTDLRIMLLIYFSMIIWRLTKMTKNGAYIIANRCCASPTNWHGFPTLYIYIGFFLSNELSWDARWLFILLLLVKYMTYNCLSK
jgi:hypothetical protein